MADGYGRQYVGVTKPLYFGMPYIQITSLNNFALGSPNQARAMDPMASSRLSIMFRICTAVTLPKFGVDFLFTKCTTRTHLGCAAESDSARLKISPVR